MPANNPASPAPYPMGNEEQQATVRRRALPIGISGAICGLGALALLLTSPTHINHPPNIYAVNLSFCAMLMGIGIIFYARHTAGTRAAVIASVIALASGFVGPLVYTKQTLDFKQATESGELNNVTAIVTAAQAYANAHDGNYPDDLATLLEQNLITIQTLHSPYESGAFSWPATLPPHNTLQKLIDDHADFQYFGAGLKTPNPKSEEDKITFAHIVVTAKRYPIARKEISIAFGDAHADFVGGEDWETIWSRSNDARRSLNFPEVPRPSTSEPTEPSPK